MHLFEVEVKSVAIDRTVRFQVEDHTNSVTAHGLLIQRAFNRLNRLLVCLIPPRGKLAIILSPAISRCERLRQLGQRETQCLAPLASQ